MPRILVVDDEPDICQMIRRYAEHDGYDTVGVSDGTILYSFCGDGGNRLSGASSGDSLFRYHPLRPGTTFRAQSMKADMTLH